MTPCCTGITRRSHIIRRHGGTGGFTLIEVLLVLGLLVVMAAFVWPSLSSPLATTRLREGARGVCTEIARARLRAIETGNVLVLRCGAGSSRYEIVTRSAALEGADSVAASDDSLGAVSAGDGTVRSWPAGRFVPVRGKLPDGIRFVGAGSVEGELDFAEEPLDEADLDSPDDTAFDSISGDFSGGLTDGTIAYLYPDGTARDATIRLANVKGASIEITLRGTTGGTRLGDVIESEVAR
jgi:type II secretory pathway pseudopilin PulG